jgi:DnaJ family protein B protein 4
MEDLFGQFGGGGGGGGYGGGYGPPAKGPDTTHAIRCTLEELFTGVTKRVKLTRRRTDAATRRPALVEEVLSIDVRPGWKAGTKVTYAGKGDEGQGGGPPGDVVFVVEEKPHPAFTRDGDTLTYTARVPLRDALTGINISVPTLDGRALPVSVAGVATPTATKVVKGEGMPVSRGPPGGRGDLHVRFDIAFPRSLSEEQKEALRLALPPA